MVSRNFPIKTAVIILSASMLFSSMSVLPLSQVYSDEVTDLEEELAETEDQLDEKEDILAETEQEIDRILSSDWSLSQKIAALDEEISSVESQIAKKEKDIGKREKDIKAKDKEIETHLVLIQNISVKLYKSSNRTFLEIALSQDNGGDLLRSYVFKKYSVSSQTQAMDQLNTEIAELNSEKDELESAKADLKSEKEALSESRGILAAELAAIQAQYAAQVRLKSSISSEISLLKETLTELQEAILIARSGGYTVPAGSVPTSADYDSSLAGFLENAPSGYMAVFAFGAYTHRLGMSQYGAKGRAEAGQDYMEILDVYYGKEPVSKETDGDIQVTGYGSMDFETEYLWGIAEMPSEWHAEALKAQAVAARTYAYRYYVDDLEICATESCQVWNQAKSDNPPQAWKDAVAETQGMVLEDVVTYYSSTSGGYLTTSGWDTSDGSGSGEWTSRAWESVGGSPWFYKSWYRNGYSISSSSCGRKPWMSPEEMSDIVNAWLVLNDIDVKGELDESRILPVTVNECPFGGISGGDPYSMSEMKALLNSPVSSISGNPIVSFDGNGNATNVHFYTNRGSIDITASDFKETFNSRAPGYLSIPQFGFEFFNIERQ